MGSIFGRRNEVFFNCAVLNHINDAVKEEVPFKAVYSLIYPALAANTATLHTPKDVANEILSVKCKTN